MFFWEIVSSIYFYSVSFKLDFKLKCWETSFYLKVGLEEIFLEQEESHSTIQHFIFDHHWLLSAIVRVQSQLSGCPSITSLARVVLNPQNSFSRIVVMLVQGLAYFCRLIIISLQSETKAQVCHQRRITNQKV